MGTEEGCQQCIKAGNCKAGSGDETLVDRAIVLIGLTGTRLWAVEVKLMNLKIIS